MSGHENHGGLERPVGRPSAPGRQGSTVVVRGGSGRLGATKDDVSSHSLGRVSRRRLAQIADELSEHDRHVLGYVDRLRFSTAAVLHVLTRRDNGQSSERSMRRTMAKLVRLGLLAALPRQVGGIGSGSSALVVHLTNAGDRLARQWTGRSERRRYAEPSTRFVQHCLDVGDALARLTEELPAYGFALQKWQSEPAAWRRYQRGSALATLKPDLYIEVAQGGNAWAYFVEVDRGSESIPTVMRQMVAYERYRRAGEEQARYGAFPPVVVTLYPGRRTPPATRAEQLRDALALDREIPDQLVHVTDAEGLVATVAALCGAGEVQS